MGKIFSAEVKKGSIRTDRFKNQLWQQIGKRGLIYYLD